MKTTFLKFILVLFVFMMISSCQKWLDVKPEDKFIKDQMYSSPEGIQEVVNGFYLKMSSPSIYGNNLTLSVLDVLAQRYLTNNTKHANYDFSEYNMETTIVQQTISSIWSEMYSLIANINDFDVNIQNVPSSIMSEKAKNQYRGEAIGLRAFLHFDLLRMFGPIYDETTKAELAIPYYRELSTDIKDLQTAEQVVNEILKDIETAEALLQADPIKTELGTDNYNNNRFNYYALMALKARVYQWINNRPKALEAAQLVIAAQNQFPWVTHTAITGNGGNPDRNFFTETIFNVFNSNLYMIYLARFSPNANSESILATGPNNYVETVYEKNASDYRYVYVWPIANEGIGYRTSLKYADLLDKKIISRFTIPIMRISEMYYIAAESTDDKVAALEYLNTVRRKRNILTDITNSSLLRAEITKEYQKEFFSEGQLWYYYKRNKTTSLPTPNTTNNKKTIALGNYKFALPQNELTGR